MNYPCFNCDFIKQTGQNGACTFDKTKVKAKVASHGGISKSPTSIINALNQYGALSVCVQVNNAFFNYKLVSHRFFYPSIHIAKCVFRV